MNFELTLELMKNGWKAYRKGWNGIEAGITMYVFLMKGVQIKHSYPSPDGNKQKYDLMDMEPFFIFYHENRGSYSVWSPSTLDTMAADWELVKEK